MLKKFRNCSCFFLKARYSPTIPPGNNQTPAAKLPAWISESRCTEHWAISKSGPLPTSRLFTAIWFITINVSEVLLIKLSAQADGNSSVMWNKPLQCWEPAKSCAEEHAGWDKFLWQTPCLRFLTARPRGTLLEAWAQRPRCRIISLILCLKFAPSLQAFVWKF